MPTNFFGTVRRKTFDGILWYPLLCISSFDNLKFLKRWRHAHEIFRQCETKNSQGKLVIPSIMHKFFQYPKFSEALKGCPRIFLALWDKKFSTETFDTHYYAETLKRWPRNFSALWDQKFSTEKRDTPKYAWNFS